MRIRLEIRRQDLPPVKLLWTTSGLRPSAAGSSKHATVVQLLEQVSEVVPLELGAAGLEDYVVEVHGYECLHFCNLDQILQEGDEVTIRPLEFTDVRSRRLSGRHQISADGRHLIDGVAFGRPFLRPGTHGGITGQDDDREADLAQLLLDAPGHLNVGGEDVDDDYLEGSDDPDLAAELEDLVEESRLAGHRSASMPSASTSARTPLKRKRSEGLGIGGVGLSAFLRSEESPNSSLRLPKRLRSSTNGAPREGSGRMVSGSSNLSVRFAESEQETPATVRLPTDSATESTDEDYQSDSAASTLSDKENRVPNSSRANDLHLNLESSTSSETSSSGSSSDSSDSEFSHGSVSNKSSAQSSETTSQDSDTSTRSSSGSSSSSSGNASSSSQDSTAPRSYRQVTPSKGRIMTRHASKTVANGIDKLDPAQAPPGAGRNNTQKRNKRRREAQRLAKLKDAGILQQDAGLKDSNDWYARFNQNEAKDYIAAAFEAKRQNLLNSIASGGVDTDPSQKASDLSLSKNKSKGKYRDDSTSVAITSHEALSKPTLNVEASKEPVSGSSGVNPAQTAENKRRVVSRHSNTITDTMTQQSSDYENTQADSIEALHDNSWKDHIILTAVECWRRPRRLATPPFPFVQRWHQNRTGRKSNNYGRLAYYGSENHNSNVELDYGDGTEAVGSMVRQPDADEPPQLSPDLPELPKDLSSVPLLRESSIKPGVIIIFKRMEMSKATNWSPIISDYRTAKVRAFDDGNLTLDLARRDRPEDQDKAFDPISGQRIYSGFEAPDMDDDADLEPGRLELDLSELIDPRLLSLADDSKSPMTEADTKPGSQRTSKGANSKSTGNHEGSMSPSEKVTEAEETNLSVGSRIEDEHRQDQEENPPAAHTNALSSPLRRSTRTRTPSKRIREDLPGTEEKQGSSEPAISQEPAMKTDFDNDDNSSVASGSISLSAKRKRPENSDTPRKSSRLTRSLRHSSRSQAQSEPEGRQTRSRARSEGIEATELP